MSAILVFSRAVGPTLEEAPHPPGAGGRRSLRLGGQGIDDQKVPFVQVPLDHLGGAAVGKTDAQRNHLRLTALQHPDRSSIGRALAMPARVGASPVAARAPAGMRAAAGRT